MKNFLIGLIAGIGNITPGISGSALLIIFGVYEECINSISNIFKNFKKSICYLFPIGLGIGIGTILFSKAIEYAINNYEVITKLIFIFFIIGTIPSLLKQVGKKSFKIENILAFIISLALGIALLFINFNTASININSVSFYTYIFLFLTGFIVAFATIVPGVSCTVLLTMFGLYLPYLKAIANLQIKLLIPIAIGVIVGGFILSKIINYLLKHYHDITFYAIIGFVVATIPALIPSNLTLNSDLLIGIILGIIALITTLFIEKRTL